MINNIKIKICGMRDPENIKQVGELMPDYLGLIFYPKSKRFVDDSNSQSILSAIPQAIKKTGVFVNENYDGIVKRINLFGLDIIQLHGNEGPELCKEIKNHKVDVIKSFGIDENFDFSILESYKDCCDYFLFDTKSSNYGGTGIQFDWEILEKYDNSKPFFLSGGIGPDNDDNIKKLINSGYPIHALDLNSKFESEPGVKNVTLLSEFINSLKTS